MFSSNVGVVGPVEIELRRADGTVEVTEAVNTFVNGGLNWLAELAADDTFSEPITELAVGEGDTAVDPEDTTLANELDRNSIDSSSVQDDHDARFVATFGEGEAVGAIVEAGLFTSDNRMVSRLTFDVRNKGTVDEIIFRWRLKMRRA